MQTQIIGVMKSTQNGTGVLRDPARSFRSGPHDVHVPADIVSRYGLIEGATVTGTVRQGKRRLELAEVATVCGMSPAAYQARTPFAGLTVIDPHERFNLALSAEKSMRIVDLIAPIGKGTRGLIVSPPKAGKTILLEHIATAIRAAAPATRIIALLIDERPEEVTHFRRAVEVEVLASSSDQSVAEHVELADLALAHVRTELECGRDVVVLIDSITRLGRASNSKGSGTGRTMSGGMEAGALEMPRRFFGLARNIEGGGSVTIIATALVDTGSRMDQLIFQEFKGTGNCEIVLSRALSEQRIFPAINILESGTRKEALLYPPEEYEYLVSLRRLVAPNSPEDAIRLMLLLLDRYPDNATLLHNLPAPGRYRSVMPSEPAPHNPSHR